MTPAMLNLATARYCPWDQDCLDCGEVLLCWLSTMTDDEGRYLDAEGEVVDSVLDAAEGISDGDYAVCSECGAVYAWSTGDEGAWLADEGATHGIVDLQELAARVAALEAE